MHRVDVEAVLQEALLGSDFNLPEARIVYEIALREELTASDLAADLALDAGYLTGKNIPAITWGPGSPKQFHTDEESVRVSDLLSMARNYRAVLAGFAGPMT